MLAFVRFWRDFLIGDDWRIAAGVCSVLTVGGLLVAATSVSHTLVALLVTAGILAVVGASIAAAR